ncbi:hypothetical protein B0H11DRAFT_1918362 [Mycena galericulata]|nr:hypothetical protein B0H11DRAFT_1918362 [Mycena galericulata]
MSVPFCASTACPLAQGVQNANTSHFSPSSPPSWSKAGAWVGRESGKHGSNCTVISDFGPHRSTLASLPTIHPALHPRGRKRESGSKESGKHGSNCIVISDFHSNFGPYPSTPVVESEGPGLVLSTPVVASESLSPLLSTTKFRSIPVVGSEGPGLVLSTLVVASESLSPLLSTTMVASEIGHSRLKTLPLPGSKARVAPIPLHPRGRKRESWSPSFHPCGRK